MSEVPSGAKTLLFRSYVGSGHDADTLSPPPRYPKTVEDIHIYLFTKVDTQESISDTHSRIKALIAGLVDVTSTTTSYHFVLEKRSKNWNTHAERSIMAAFRKISAAPVRVTRSVKGHRDSLLSQYLNDRWAFNDIDGNGWKIVADPVTTKHLARLEAAFLVRGSVPAWEGVIPLAQDHLFLKLNSRVACFR
jgi:hypothetical protein